MAINLESLHVVKADKAPRILIYGPPGIGKTTLASEFPSPVFLQVEDGTPAGLELVSFGKLDTFTQVIDALSALYTEKHNYKTLVLDSVTELQKLVFAETCIRGDDKGNPKSDIEHFGYKTGYTYALRVWQELIDGLNALRRDRGMTIVLIAHSVIQRFDDPETVSYDRYTIDLHHKSVGLVEREMDAIFLIKQPVQVQTENQGFNKERAIADSKSVVLIHTRGAPAWVAKNRYKLPETLRYDEGKGFQALAPYLPIVTSEKKEKNNG